ncbi:MAG: glycoside hydrolase family 15 protein [Ignavibacteria bacterium]
MIRNPAPGSPGIEPKWTSSAKSAVGTSITKQSRVWFTISHGIINEVYYPKIDRACIRDFGFLVSCGNEYFSEEKRDTESKISLIKDGIPAVRVISTSLDGKYVIEKIIITDPENEVLIQKINFKVNSGSLKDFHLYALIAPHIGNRGYGNTAWVDDYKNVPMLFAKRNDIVACIGSSAPMIKRSAGFVGFSDGWQDVSLHNKMEWEYNIAENGNVAMIGEIDVASCKGEFTIALGFGQNPESAGFRVRSSIQKDFDKILDSYLKGWKDWFKSIQPSGKKNYLNKRNKLSASVLKTHSDKSFPGGIIASISVPWGTSKSDYDLGGYHLVWTRDLVECAGGLLACGAGCDVLDVLNYLRTTQDDDGHWPQNMWLDGGKYWNGIQMDEVAFPIILLAHAYREGLISVKELKLYYGMLKKAAAFIIQNGPVTQQDRWEEDSGYSPFTLAVEISALVSAAGLFNKLNDAASSDYCLCLADYWNSSIEKWCYIENSDFAEANEVKGYYVRISPEVTSDASSPIMGFVAVKNRPPGDSVAPAAHIISVDALALVRFGLRDAKDERILNTIKVIDKYLKVDTPSGPAWHRYNGDGYGEQSDGSDFDGTGIGRAWPLLTGERAHYEIAAGNITGAKSLLKSLESFSNELGLIPEQIWDSDDIPSKILYKGKPTGSAMPLAWAHAEHLKLTRSIKDKKIFDMPEETYSRYAEGEAVNTHCCWRTNNKFRAIQKGKVLRIELLQNVRIEWSTDGWKTFNENEMNNTIFGMYYLDINTNNLNSGNVIKFRMKPEDNTGQEIAEYEIMIE